MVQHAEAPAALCSRERQSLAVTGLRLAKVIDVNPVRCINCHACIMACPVKFCNNGSGNHVEINPDLCIGCGSCVDACTHGARVIVDDLEAFLEALGKGQKLVAIVAPAVAANFPRTYLRLNGWLRAMGVKAVFDVSFGAELTVKTYLDYIQEKNPRTVIAQPCPAIVSYVEIYRPDLLPYLAPADSPMLHTIKMAKRFYTEYTDAKVAIISPCAAKRREFDEIGLGDFNVTMKRLQEHFQKNGINLGQFPECDYDNSPAERAVLFSTPGGLRETLERWSKDAAKATRKIEGVPTVYHYLDELPQAIRKGKAPLLVDCLNCEMGCNGGTATLARSTGVDEIESLISERAKEMKRKHLSAQASDDDLQQKVLPSIDEFWEPNLYQRNYVNRSQNNCIKKPSEAEIARIYLDMKKKKKEDFLNCAACGYGSCEMMAIAIYNGLNRPQNCHKYQEAMIIENAEQRQEVLRQIMVEFSETVDGILAITRDASSEADSVDEMSNAIIRLSNQAQILALNAAIEAGRAGAAGAGFGVVADAVKEMSQSVKLEASRIKPHTHKLNEALAQVVKEVDRLSERVSRVFDHVKAEAEAA